MTTQLPTAPKPLHFDPNYFSSLRRQLQNKPIAWCQAFIRDALTKAIARWLQKPTHTINVRRPIFKEHELPLQVSYNLMQWLSALLQCQFQPSLFAENPTLDALARFITWELKAKCDDVIHDSDWQCELADFRDIDKHRVPDATLIF